MTHWRANLMAAGLAADDPLWQMPLWAPYDAMMNSKIADVNNAGSGGFAGSVTAALFLKRFVSNAAAWVHLDIFGWAPEARAARSRRRHRPGHSRRLWRAQAALSRIS